ncbi:MAG: hypothetical protein NZ740_02250 [Kiritimatiellae bacterium]|nr:hypothetical protein [Kiritimatiellia bacterium]MDW8457913.1 hypothetical protein [Verrucomicrobiota bacterium]
MKWIFGILLGASCCLAANLAYDDASDPAYSGGWTNGANGGYGFAPWVIPYAGTNTLTFVQSSTVNGDGDSNADGDIDTAGVAWGLASELGLFMVAYRPFTGGPLQPGQSLNVAFDTGFDDPSEETGQGIGLGNSALDEYYFVFYRASNSLTYLFSDALNDGSDTGIPVSDEGGQFTFSMVGPTNYLATVTMIGGGTYSWSGSLSNAPESFLVGRTFGTNFSSSAESYRIFINRLEIVPEAHTSVLCVAGALAAIMMKRLTRFRIVTGGVTCAGKGRIRQTAHS